jgi:hypothetical protein
MLTTSEIDKIEIKPVNVGMYNTIDLQNGLSENIKKFFESEQNKAAEKIDQKYNTRPFNTGSGAIVNTGSNTDPFREDAIRLTGSNGPVISLKSFSPADNELDEVPGKEEDVQITTFIPRYKEEIGGTTGSGLPVKESADKKYSETAVSDITEDEKTAKTAKAAGRYPAEDPLKTVKEDINEKSPEPEDDTDPELKSIYEDWEKLKKENEERRVQEAKVLSLQQTADIMAKLKGVLPEIDDIAKPTPMRGVGTAAPYFTMPEVPEYTEEAQEEPEQEPVQPEEAPEEKSVYAQEDTPASYSGGEIDFARKDEREEEYPAAEELPEAEAQPDTQEEEYPETEEQPEAEAQPDTQEEEYPETEEQPEAEAQPDTQEEIYPETEEQPEAEAQTDTQEEIYPETEEQPEAEAQADTQEEIYPETEEQPEAEAQADTQEEIYPETEEQPEAEAQADIQEEYPDTEGISDTEELPNVEELPRVEVRKEDFPKTEELPEIDVQEDYPEAEDISETDELPEIEPRKEGTHDTEELPGRIELPEADEQEDYPETEDIPEIETREEEYPEEETQDEVSPDNEAEETEQEEDYTVDQSPMQEIFYEPEMADDSWAEEEARGKTEEMPIREVTYELEAEAFDLKNIQSAEAEKKGSEAKDSDEMYFREIMSIEDPDDDEELIPEGMNGSDDGGEKVQKEDFDVTVELPEYPFEELDDYGEVEEMTMIEQPEGLDGIMKTDDMPVDALAKANYEAGLEFDYEEIDFHRTRRITDREISKRRRPGYMTLDRSPESKRDFDEEEKLVFGRFQEIEWFKSKIVELLDTAGMEPGKGNVIITGSDPNGRKSLAVDIVKVMRATEVKFKGKVAKISGEALNKKDIPLTIKKLNQGALIVENAQDLTPSSVRLVAEALELESYPILVILEGDKEGLSEVMESSKEIMSRVFDSRIELQEYSTDDLVSYGKSYARELEYTIDDMGVLALYRRIGDLQTHDHNATLEEVCEIIDNAIKHVDKKNVSHFMDVLLAKRYDDNDYIILREKDFIQ